MRGADLKYLAATADLARLDLEAAALTLSRHGGQILANYRGTYSSGWRQLPTDDPDDFHISVSAAQFRALSTLIADDTQVLLKRDAIKLILRTPGTSLQLRQWGEESEPEAKQTKADIVAQLPVSDLLPELDAAIDFVAQSYIRPALTGFRLTFDQDSLRVMAFDGSGALFESAVPARIRGFGEIIVPAADFRLGLRLVGDGKVTVMKPMDQPAVVMSNSRSLFRSSLLAGDWPDIMTITSIENTAEFTVASGQIKNLIATSKVLQSGPDVEVVQRTGDRVTFGIQSETGNFSTTVKGRIPANLRYDATVLGLTANLGPELTFKVPNAAYLPTLVQSGHRRAWIMTRI